MVTYSELNTARRRYLAKHGGNAMNKLIVEHGGEKEGSVALGHVPEDRWPALYDAFGGDAAESREEHSNASGARYNIGAKTPSEIHDALAAMQPAAMSRFNSPPKQER